MRFDTAIEVTISRLRIELMFPAPPAAVGDVAELFDVHVHQLARRRPLVAALRPAAGPVQVRQPLSVLDLERKHHDHH